METKEIIYSGYEVGPIRPPSEGESLLVRVTRNCPWNQCKFCGLYKNMKFSIRPKEQVFQDLNMIKDCIDDLLQVEGFSDVLKRKIIDERRAVLGSENIWALRMAQAWYHNGMHSIFLQDANTMILNPDYMVDILNHIRALFPEVKRITSYGRSHTISRITDEDLKRFAYAGLNRIHIGMETASNQVLILVKKGVDKETHIQAGQKVKKAGIELSEYYMPGLGGNEYWRESAIETADAINQINPDYIRIRTLAIPGNTDLSEDYKNGVFTRANNTRVVEEIVLFIENLRGIQSGVKSDHILNLIPEVVGVLPSNKQKILSALKWYLNLSPEDKMFFVIGRRAGILRGISDFSDQSARSKIQEIIHSNQITLRNVDQIADEMMKQFI